MGAGVKRTATGTVKGGDASAVKGADAKMKGKAKLEGEGSGLEEVIAAYGAKNEHSEGESKIPKKKIKIAKAELDKAGSAEGDDGVLLDDIEGAPGHCQS